MDNNQIADFIRSHFHKVQYAPSVNVLYSMDAYLAGMILLATQAKLLTYDEQMKIVEEQHAIFNKRMEELKARESK